MTVRTTSRPNTTRLPRGRVSLAHGGGGQLTDALLRGLVLPHLGNPILSELLDSAVLPAGGEQQLALTVDGYVVQPRFFPGGDIGRLAVSGTVNDLAVAGARPVGIALGMILEDGLPEAELDRILASVRTTAEEAGVHVVTGDTKVVGHGAADGVYLTTAGLGLIPEGRALAPGRVRTGDAILINGPIADHGMTVMLAREMPEIESPLRSDAAPLNGLIEDLHAELGSDVVFLRDATRGGLSGVVCDLASSSLHRVVLDDTRIPLRASTRHAAEMLGIDPLDVANEGKVVVVVRKESAARALECLRRHELGREGALIGRIEERTEATAARCELVTRIGGRRLLQKPYGEQLPRIC